jgi:hypothetical protein
VQHFHATSSHLHNLVYWSSAKNGELLYLWGQKDRARVYKFNGDNLDETPLMIRPEKTHGHPGGMLSLSANGDRDGILWAAIHASGDSWHESRPGILHAYDADDITHELWNSLENAKRDDCNRYSKMAPATVANGKVYLSSFGTKNIGTGQLCVYGLLPNGASPAPPAHLNAVINDRFVVVDWSPVPDARTYTVESTQGGKRHVIASGLTLPSFSEPAADRGVTEYTVMAVNANGHSVRSLPAVVTITDVPGSRMDH